jgi:hypothetical protein
MSQFRAAQFPRVSVIAVSKASTTSLEITRVSGKPSRDDPSQLPVPAVVSLLKPVPFCRRSIRIGHNLNVASRRMQPIPSFQVDMRRAIGTGAPACAASIAKRRRIRLTDANTVKNDQITIKVILLQRESNHFIVQSAQQHALETGPS